MPGLLYSCPALMLASAYVMYSTNLGVIGRLGERSAQNTIWMACCRCDLSCVHRMYPHCDLLTGDLTKACVQHVSMVCPCSVLCG